MSKQEYRGLNHIVKPFVALGVGKCSCGMVSGSFQKHLIELPYKNATEWYWTMKDNNYSVPVQAPHLLSKLMERDKLSFKDAYAKAINEGGVILSGDIYFTHFGYLTKLIEDTRNK